MGYWDIAILEDLEGDGEKYRSLMEILGKKAHYKAQQYFLGSEQAYAVAQQALDKAVDWLRTDKPYHVNKPMGYVKTLIDNAIKDAHKTRNIESLPFNMTKKALAPITGRPSHYDPEDDDLSEQNQSPDGLHVIQIKDIDKIKTNDEYKHPWLKALNTLPHRKGWFSGKAALAYIQQKENKARNIKKPSRVLYQEYKQREKQYNLINSLIDSIQGLKEKEVMKFYLWGYDQVDIAKYFNVSKPYISKVTQRWIDTWGWTKLEFGKYKVLTLTHNLADMYSHYGETHGNIKRGLDPYSYSKLYKDVVNSQETAVYFSDLRQDDEIKLGEVGALCYAYWHDLDGLLMYHVNLFDFEYGRDPS